MLTSSTIRIHAMAEWPDGWVLLLWNNHREMQMHFVRRCSSKAYRRACDMLALLQLVLGQRLARDAVSSQLHLTLLAHALLLALCVSAVRWY